MSAGRQEGLVILVECGPWLVAVDATRVDRLLLLDELAPVAGEGAPNGPSLGAYEGSGQRVDAWDLATLLELEETPRSWLVLSRSASAGGALALRAGRCLAVVPRPRLSPVPVGVFGARPGAIEGVLAIVREGEERLVVSLNVDALWSGSELISRPSTIGLRRG